MSRRYSVDDCDYEDYRRNGGNLSRAGYFNALLGPPPKIQLGYTGYQDKARTSLSERLREHLKK